MKAGVEKYCTCMAAVRNKTNTPASKRLIALIGRFIFKDPSSGNIHIDHTVDVFTSICHILIIEYESISAASNV